jgi:hypothetical protein
MKSHNDPILAPPAVPGRKRWEGTSRGTALALMIVGLQSGLSSLSFAASASCFSPAQGEAALAQLRERGLYDSLQEAVGKARYGVYPEPGQPRNWRADNPAQQIRSRFTAEGVQVEARSGERPSWCIGMKLRSVGYGDRPVEISAAHLTTSGSRIEYSRSMLGNEGAVRGAITEWYVNRAGGLEHGFTLDSAPGERREGERLRVVLLLEGDLQAQSVDGGQAVEFNDAVGQRQLRYDHLMVIDGKGRELEAQMEVRSQGSESQIWLEVDDRDAVWPVTIDPTFIQQDKLLAADAASSDGFGLSVAISGETVVVGAPFDRGPTRVDQGSVYVFVRSGAVWRQQQKLLPSDTTELGRFGDSVAISGETIVVGAPGAFGLVSGSAYVFVRAGEVWRQQQQLLPWDGERLGGFGESVAISGETVVVGTPFENNFTGGVYVFVRDGDVWREQQKLVARGAEPFERSGNSVAISAETVVIGAVGANSLSGAVYVFVRSGETWSQQQKLLASDAAPNERFGNSVAISGETVVIGMPLGAAGSAYVFVRTGEVWNQQQKVLAADAAPNDRFGFSVAISGELVVIGAPFADGVSSFDQGAVYVFARSGEVWSQREKLEASSDGELLDQFGDSVAISGEAVVVGAPTDDDAAGSDQGSMYVFGP